MGCADKKLQVYALYPHFRYPQGRMAWRPTMTLQNQSHHQKGKYQTLEMEKLKTHNSTLTSSDAKEREMRPPS